MRVRSQQMSVEKDVLENHGAKLAPVFTCTKNAAKRIFQELVDGKAELKTLIEYTLLNFAVLGKEKKVTVMTFFHRELP